jgi:hypothetical protein
MRRKFHLTNLTGATNPRGVTPIEKESAALGGDQFVADVDVLRVGRPVLLRDLDPLPPAVHFAILSKVDSMSFPFSHLGSLPPVFVYGEDSSIAMESKQESSRK